MIRIRMTEFSTRCDVGRSNERSGDNRVNSKSLQQQRGERRWSVDEGGDKAWTDEKDIGEQQKEKKTADGKWDEKAAAESRSKDDK